MSKSILGSKVLNINFLYNQKGLRSGLSSYHNYPVYSIYYLKGKSINIDKATQKIPEIYQAMLQKRQYNKNEISALIKILPSLNTFFQQVKKIIHKDVSVKETTKESKFLDIESNLLTYMHFKGFITKHYWNNIFFNKHEFDFYNVCTEKITIKGEMLPFENHENYEKLREKVFRLINVYNKGLEMSDYERGLYYSYLEHKIIANSKQIEKKLADYKNSSKKGNIYNVDTKITYKDCVDYDHWINTKTKVLKMKRVHPSSLINFKKNTVNDIIKKYDLSTIFSNYSITHPMFTKLFCNDTCSPFQIDIHKYLLARECTKTVKSVALSMLADNSHLGQEKNKAYKIATNILFQLFSLLQSEIFLKEFDPNLDFYLHHSFFSMYVWLICQRINDFTRSSLAFEVNKILKELVKKYIKNFFDEVDTIRKLSKMERINETYELQKNMLHWHFNIYALTKDNPYFKIDSLVWTYIFREKVHRYDDQVYKMSWILVNEFNRLNSLVLEDFKNGEVGFDFLYYNIPPNYKQIVLNYNLHNFEQIKNYAKENENSYKIKEYTYHYRLEEEKDKSIYLQSNMNQTNFISDIKRNLELRSNRLEDESFDYKKEKEDNSSPFFKSDQDKSSSSFLEKGVDYLNQKFSNTNLKLVLEEEENRQIDSLKHTNTKINTSTSINSNENEEIESAKVNLSRFLDSALHSKVNRYSENLLKEKNAKNDNYINLETKIFYPEANVVNRKVKKTLVERLFNL